MSRPAFLFLDVDGVLNGDDWLSRVGHNTLPFPMRDINPICCARLIESMQGLPVDIVLSSSWRIYPRVNAWMSFCGLTIFDHTPDLKSEFRGYEITAFLQVTPKLRPYVILDDEDDFRPEQLPYLVRTNPKQGLTHRKALELRRRLELVTHE